MADNSSLSGADVTMAMNRPKPADGGVEDMRKEFLSSFVLNNLHLTRTFYTHPKILVAALNGPVVGLSAALTALADFVYCTPSTFLLTPFSSLGLVAEGGASRALVRRLGPARANEALLMSKRITARELRDAGFVNEIFDVKDGEAFRQRVVREVEDRLGEHLNGESLLEIKKLVKIDESEMDRVNVREVYAGLERFMKGMPQEEFGKVARGEKRHKL
jgi:Delta3-Delta2-enoyl-CoA isomerase